jgi:uncharacterized membrane protein
MKTRKLQRATARYNWDRLRVSFWFAPLVMSVVAILLAWVMYWLDALIPNEALQDSHIILAGSVDQLRISLVNMATSTLTTAGVVFTLLTLPLSTVAAQYGSRLLRVFLGDRITQFVLGMFVATFVYCISAATSIPPIEKVPDAPQITATFGLLLMLGTFASLILLVQHISTMLQAPNIVAAAGAELLEVIFAETPDEVGISESQPQNNREAPETLLESEAYPVQVESTGHIQYIDLDYILTLAREQGLFIRVMRKPGLFVWQGTTVALVWPAAKVDIPLSKQIRRAFHFGRQRVPTQDLLYAVNQLTEIAVRAMSPAINDPFTAMTCMDYLGEGLAIFARQGEKKPEIYGHDGKLHIIFEPLKFDELLKAAFNMARHCSSDNASVLLHMLDVIDKVGREAQTPEMRQKLLEQVILIQAESQAGALIEQDRHLIQVRGDVLRENLQVN